MDFAQQKLNYIFQARSFNSIFDNTQTKHNSAISKEVLSILGEPSSSQQSFTQLRTAWTAEEKEFQSKEKSTCALESGYIFSS